MDISTFLTLLHPTGIELISKALKIPTYTIANNAGVDAQEVVTKVVQGKAEIGYDAMTGEFVDMIASGIIDPTKVRMEISHSFGLLSVMCNSIFTNQLQTS